VLGIVLVPSCEEAGHASINRGYGVTHIVGDADSRGFGGTMRAGIRCQRKGDDSP
jgi:hypothetical protein